MTLLTHAERELERAGMNDPDADYDGAIAGYVLDLMRVFASQGHSGGSAMLTLAVFEKLARYQPLSPLTNDPDEWQDRTGVGGVDGPMWQSRRQSTAFSLDGGKTYYVLNDDGTRGPTFVANYHLVEDEENGETAAPAHP